MDLEQQNAPHKSSKKRGLIQISILFFLLIVTPYLSWYYLSRGLDYRKETMAHLGDFGFVPSALSDEFKKVEPAVPDTSFAFMIIGHCYDPSDCAALKEVFIRLSDPFGNRKDVRMVHVYPDGMMDTSAVTDTAEGQGVAQIVIEQDTLNTLKSYWSEVFGSEVNHHLFLVDKNYNVRQAFDFKDEKQLSNLIHTATVMLPLRKINKAILQRESEK